ncbi:MAG: F0F1 ATP synthase subunit epsilon [Bacteroidota bacterium]
MNLKILLPFKVFAEVKNVSRLVLETSQGSYGVLPQRLDFVAALVPGIFTYESEKDGVQYVAVDTGVIIKAGDLVLVSVRNAIGGADLGKLGELVKKDFKTKDENQKQVTTVIAKLERGFIYSFDKLRNN